MQRQIPTAMMLGIGIVFLTTASAGAEPVKLRAFSVEEVQAKCVVAHGAFYKHDDGKYGCAYSKGVVQCDADQKCAGYAKRKVRPRAPVQHAWPQWGERWYHNERW